MKKKNIYDMTIDSLVYPNSATGTIEGRRVSVKNGLPGQQLSVQITKLRRNRVEARICQVTDRAPYEVDSFCEHFGECGGCARQTVPYERQLDIKLESINALFAQNDIALRVAKIIASPSIYHYRNKMEYSFGDLAKGGQLNLGMHRKGRFYDVVSIPRCHIVDDDYNTITAALERLCRTEGWAKYNRNSGEGVMRNLVIRKGCFTGEILIGLATSSASFDVQKVVDTLLALQLKGQIVGIYHLINDDVADVVKPQPGDHLVYGRDYFYEKICGMTFKVSFHSFFQTNSRGAEVLYREALALIPDLDDKVVYDLFSGTGTIAQIVAQSAKSVQAIEIVADAVAAAKQNARDNGVTNCTFLTGDVFKILDEVTEKPDVIIVDPPRAGMTPKTVQKIADYDVAQILYISCNPKTMVANLKDFFARGYALKSCFLVDLYPHTPLVEAVALLTK
ncbi:MAG: 23S rRNA (uracil(1939)-C(5))-methyltransferase RlmD [Clostridiales bacterium]|nr:MAG: 23S rRNA (uracil(1939)-C(5))-methyltransferase RlmD [Clostridiales bacterium]